MANRKTYFGKIYLNSSVMITSDQAKGETAVGKCKERTLH